MNNEISLQNKSKCEIMLRTPYASTGSAHYNCSSLSGVLRLSKGAEQTPPFHKACKSGGVLLFKAPQALKNCFRSALSARKYTEPCLARRVMVEARDVTNTKLPKSGGVYFE